MACVNADGTLTAVAERVLRALLDDVLTPEEIARATEIPLYRARASLRELAAAGYLAEDAGGWRLTDAGRARVVA